MYSKYGNAHRQLRALTILDGLIDNAGSTFQRTFADEPLLDRLRQMPRDDLIDEEVRNKCNVLFRQWAVAYQATPGLGGIAQLARQLPKRRRPTASQSRILAENEREAQRDNPFAEPSPPSTPSPTNPRRPSYGPSPASSLSSPTTASRPRATSSGNIFASKLSAKRHGHSKHTPFSLSREKPTILRSIASSSIASTNLLNALKRINRETQLASSDPDVVKYFEECKALRRQILRYIQHVESEEWIGSLLSANDELVKGLMAYEIFEKGFDDDSDSEAEAGAIAAVEEAERERKPSTTAVGSGSQARGPGVEDSMSGLSLLEQAPTKPPRPGQSALRKTSLAAAPPPIVKDDDTDDDDDPFGDQNAIKT